MPTFATDTNKKSMDILTNTISLLFRPRQKEIARFAQDADAIQHKQLKSLLSTARNTEWGLKYDYKSIQGYADFCERIPLQTYDDIKPYVTRMINGERNILWPSVVRWNAKSSGTTNDKSKFLPVTPEILKGCHYKGGFDTVSIYLRNHPDSHFFAGFMNKISDPLLNAYPGKIINIHPALLPKYGGKGMYGIHVHKAVIAAGERETGITIHYIDEHYDEGTVIFQAKCPVLPSDTPEEVAAKVHALEYAHYPKVIEDLLAARI